MKSTLNEYKENSIEVYEVLRKKKMGFVEVIADLFLEQLLTIKDAFSSNGEYFLFIYPNKALLVNQRKKLIVEEFDVTDKIDISTKFKKFEFDGFIYKKYRKL